MTINNSINYPVLDEDDFASDSASAIVTQQSFKAYVDAAPIGTGAFDLISTTTISGSPTEVDFTSLSTDYDIYLFYFINWNTAAGNVQLFMRTSTDNGSSFDSGATDYAHSGRDYTTGDTTPAQDTEIDILPYAPSGAINFRVVLMTPTDASYNTTVFSDGLLDDANYFLSSGRREATEDNDAVRFLIASSTMSSGTIKQYGLASS